MRGVDAAIVAQLIPPASAASIAFALGVLKREGPRTRSRCRAETSEASGVPITGSKRETLHGEYLDKSSQRLDGQ